MAARNWKAPKFGSRGPAMDQPVRILAKLGDVGLGVAAVDADRVQLQDLAGEVLVEAEAAALAGPGMRPDRLGVVEIEQHRRMARDGEQHVAEAAE